MCLDQLGLLRLQFAGRLDQFTGNRKHPDVMQKRPVVQDLPLLLRQRHFPGNLLADADCHGRLHHHLTAEESLTVHQHLQELLLVLVIEYHVFDNIIQFLQIGAASDLLKHPVLVFTFIEEKQSVIRQFGSRILLEHAHLKFITKRCRIMIHLLGNINISRNILIAIIHLLKPVIICMVVHDHLGQIRHRGQILEEQIPIDRMCHTVFGFIAQYLSQLIPFSFVGADIMQCGHHNHVRQFKLFVLPLFPKHRINHIGHSRPMFHKPWIDYFQSIAHQKKNVFALNIFHNMYPRL